jgi:hypothetical protein
LQDRNVRIRIFPERKKILICSFSLCSVTLQHKSAAEAETGDKRLSVMLANFVNRTNVRMIQRRCRTRLSAKTLQSLRILGQLVREKLKREKPSD